jgi:hypothetical protein
MVWTTALLVSSSLAPLAGVALDRLGPRVFGLAATVVFAAALCTLSVANSTAVVFVGSCVQR